MNRFNKIMIAALAVQVALVFVVRLGAGHERIAPPRPLLADFSAGGVKSIELSSSGDDAKTIELKRSGDGWVLASHFDYPADGDKVDELLDKLAAASARAPVTRATSRHHQLKVADDEFERKIELGGVSQVVLLGKPVGARKTAARLAGADAVYAVPGLSPGSSSRVDPSAWIDTQYFHVEQDQIARLSIASAGGTVVLVREGGQWQPIRDGQPLAPPTGKQLDTATIDAWARQAATVRVKEPADPAKAPAAPAVTVTVQLAAPAPAAGAPDAGMSVAPEGDVYVLELTPEGDGFRVQQRGEQHAVIVAKYGADKLAEASEATLWK